MIIYLSKSMCVTKNQHCSFFFHRNNFYEIGLEISDPKRELWPKTENLRWSKNSKSSFHPQFGPGSLGPWAPGARAQILKYWGKYVFHVFDVFDFFFEYVSLTSIPLGGLFVLWVSELMLLCLGPC